MTRRAVVHLFGVPIDERTPDEFIEDLEVLVDRPEQGLVCPVNADMLNQCYHNTRLRRFIASADMIQAESSGVLLAAKLCGKPIACKLTSNELMYHLAEVWQHKDYSLYFLGGPEGQAALAVEKLHERYPGLHIAGFHRGHLSEAETEAVIQEINASGASVLMVGFGCPIQEAWLEDHRHALTVPVLWPLGNITSYIAGTAKTAPQWMKDHSLEWLYRLYLEPKRMWRRYVLGNPLFVFRILWRERLGL